MKRLVIMIIIIALAFTACSTDNDNGDSRLTINGLPSDNDGVYSVYVWTNGMNISTVQALSDGWQAKTWEAFGTADSGSNVFTLYAYTEKDYYDKHWTKSGNFPVSLRIDNNNNITQYYYATVNFSDGNGTTQFSSFTLCQ